MLYVEKVKKSFGAVRALSDVSLKMDAGEIRALLGANGSGKSTLVKILGGINKQDGGRIEIDGKPADIRSPKDSTRLGLAVAYQDLSLLPRLSVAENIVIANEPGGISGINKKSTAQVAEKFIKKLNINALPDTLVADLDISNQSLVEVAKALYRNPQILVLDEITASLHHDQVEILFRVLKELKNDGLSILFVSHRLDEVFSLCDTSTILREGVSVADMPLSGTNREEIVFYMTGKRIDASAFEALTENKDTGRDSLLSVDNMHIPNRISGVSLYANRGEIIGIAGLQGQGQGEFIRALYGAIPYREGTVKIGNERIRAKSPADAIRSGIGFISGDREKEGIFHIRSVAENLFVIKTAMSRLLSGISYKKQNKEAQILINKLNIVSGGTNMPANSLSGGNQQKLVVGRWLVTNPKVLLLDDPTKGVDVSSRNEIHGLMREMTKTGMAIVFYSSDNEELLQVVSRIYVFYEGKIIRELTGKDKTGENLASAMMGIG